MRGSHNVLESIESDLRAEQPLVNLLPSPEAIYIGHPADDRDFMAAVTLTTIFNGSTRHRGATTRDYRIQATVKTTQQWREWYDSRDDEPASLTEQARILTRVADVLDNSGPTDGPEIPTGGEGGPEPMEMDDGRLAMSSDWTVQGTYSHR